MTGWRANMQLALLAIIAVLLLVILVRPVEQPITKCYSTTDRLGGESYWACYPEWP